MDHIHIEEVKHAEHDQNQADVRRLVHDELLERVDGFFGAHPQEHEAHVDEVEADHQQVVRGHGDLHVPVESPDQERQAVSAQGAGDVDGDEDAQGQVNQLVDRVQHWFSPYRVCDPALGGSDRDFEEKAQARLLN